MGAHVGVMSPSTSSTCFRSLPPPSLTKTKLSPMSSMSTSQDPVREWILSDGKATKITKISPVGGGCINLASRYDTDAGSFFVKTNRSIGPSMFEAEALGLGAMYETGTIRVPKPYKVGPLPPGGSFIIMEFIEFGASRGNQPVLGRKLAEMHKAGKSSKGYGFDVDNTIGSTPQINTWSSDWVQFYGEHRLGYQLKLALDQYGDRTIYEKGQRLVKSMGPLFHNVAVEPCLLHGDLWSGNISSDKNGEPVILDPACYYGHSEAEFGMSWCAGFGGSFYNSYFEEVLTCQEYEQQSPVSVLQVGEDEFSPFDQSLANIERRKQKFMQTVQRLENLAKFDLENLEQSLLLGERVSGNDEDDDEHDNEEVEEQDWVEERARQLLQCVKANDSMQSCKDYLDTLLLDFFREELAGMRNQTWNDDDRFELEILRKAEDWINGSFAYDIELINKDTYIKDMDRTGRWSRFEEEKDELTLEIEAAILHSLVGDLLDLDG